MDSFDLLIVGGGINGAAIARDAAGRGLKVLLVEKDDLAAHTSSASSKLIHGGLRYLEHYEFKLVRESLAERETKWAAFISDPAWHKARDDSERDGQIIANVSSQLLAPTAFSSVK